MWQTDHRLSMRSLCWWSESALFHGGLCCGQGRGPKHFLFVNALCVMHHVVHGTRYMEVSMGTICTPRATLQWQLMDGGPVWFAQYPFPTAFTWLFLSINRLSERDIQIQMTVPGSAPQPFKAVTPTASPSGSEILAEAEVWTLTAVVQLPVLKCSSRTKELSAV